MTPGKELSETSAARGLDLGRRVASYDERDAILYALAVGAPADALELVFERDLRVLPTYGLALGLWAADELHGRGLIDPSNALHGAQRLEVLAPLPRAGAVEMTASIAEVWDKRSAVVYDVAVESEHFRATYSIFQPGRSGWGGERGPSQPKAPAAASSERAVVPTLPQQAALYRLTGDRHLIHIDPAAAASIGQPRPILHGLCTLAIVVRALADMAHAHPCDLVELSARFSAPVLPGDDVAVAAWEAEAGVIPFAATTASGPALTAGRVRFDG